MESSYIIFAKCNTKGPGFEPLTSEVRIECVTNASLWPPLLVRGRVRNLLSKNWYFSVQKALIYCTVNKSHHNSFILLVFSQVANFRYVANFRFLTLIVLLSNFMPLFYRRW